MKIKVKNGFASSKMEFEGTLKEWKEVGIVYNPVMGLIVPRIKRRSEL